MTNIDTTQRYRATAQAMTTQPRRWRRLMVAAAGGVAVAGAVGMLATAPGAAAGPAPLPAGPCVECYVNPNPGVITVVPNLGEQMPNPDIGLIDAPPAGPPHFPGAPKCPDPAHQYWSMTAGRCVPWPPS